MEKVKNFISEMDEYIISKHDFDYSNISLFGGVTGVIYYCFSSKNESLKDKGYDLLNNLLANILDNKVSRYPYANGICGVLYLLNYLKEFDHLDDDIEGFVSPIEEHIVKNIIGRDYSIDNKDFLYGVLGYLHYFASKSINKVNEDILSQLIDDLSRNSIREDEKMYVTNNFYNKEKITFSSDSTKRIEDVQAINLGLAHGNLALGLILLNILGKYPNISTAQSMIIELANIYIESFNRDNINTSNTLFPNLKIENQKTIYNSMPLSWCYGDLSIALFLYRVYQETAIEKYKDISLLTLNHHISKNSIGTQDIDLYYCHGYTGAVAQYESLYELIKEEKLKDEAQKWSCELGVKLIKQIVDTDPNKLFNDSLDLLDGVLSIGLLYNSKMRSWKQIFLN